MPRTITFNITLPPINLWTVGVLKEPSMTYGPNGAQCVECANWMKGCEHLPFHEMKVIKVYPEDQFKMVVCVNYLKETE